MYENTSDIFIDGTYYWAPKDVYQIVITRVALENHHKYFTISYTLALHKNEETYRDIFNKINVNIKNYQLKNNKNISYRPKVIHCDMESALINAAKFIQPFDKIKICFFHWHQGMEKQRKKYKNLLEINLTNQETFKSLITLPLISSDMVGCVFNYLRDNNQDFELEELF